MRRVGRSRDVPLAGVVVAFQRAHPGVRVSIVPGNSAQTMDAVRSHRAELGVVGGFAAAPEIEAEPLVEAQIVVVGAPGLGSRWMSRRDAEAATWISPYQGSATQAAVDAAWADIGVIPSHRLKYKIRIRLGGRYLLAVWWADANSRRDEPVWLKTVASKAAAERAVKQWIDDRQPKLPRHKGRR